MPTRIGILERSRRPPHRLGGDSVVSRKSRTTFTRTGQQCLEPGGARTTGPDPEIPTFWSVSAPIGAQFPTRWHVRDHLIDNVLRMKSPNSALRVHLEPETICFGHLVSRIKYQYNLETPEIII